VTRRGVDGRSDAALKPEKRWVFTLRKANGRDAQRRDVWEVSQDPG